jgi:5-formyltetrahydrofolate cyclo-ligase
MLDVRDQLSPDVRTALTARIVQHTFAAIQAFAPHADVLSYIAFRNELDLRDLHEQLWAAGYRIAIPRVQKATKQLDWRMLYRYDDLQPGYAGIMEPSLDLIPWVQEPSRPVVVLVPGLAFTTEGYRLGYGGGFYDRFAAEHGWLGKSGAHVLKVAPTFGAMVVDQVPMDAHDVVVDVVITEDGP